MAAGGIISFALILAGVALLINLRGKPEKYHAIMRLAWGQMDHGGLNRAIRSIYLFPGRAPFGVFRFGGAAFFLAAGILGLIASL